MKEITNNELNGYSSARTLLIAKEAACAVANDLLEAAGNTKLHSSEQQKKIGQAFYQLGDYSSAQKHLTAAYVHHPNSDTAIRIALSYWRAGQLSEAEEWANKAIESNATGSFDTLISKTSPTYYSVLAEIQMRRGDVECAKVSAQAGLKVNEKDVTSLMVLATASLAEGKNDLALNQSQAAAEFAPDFLGGSIREKADQIKRFVDNDLPLSLNFTEALERAL